MAIKANAAIANAPDNDIAKTEPPGRVLPDSFLFKELVRATRCGRDPMPTSRSGGGRRRANALDQESKRDMWTLIKRLRRSMTITVIAPASGQSAAPTLSWFSRMSRSRSPDRETRRWLKAKDGSCASAPRQISAHDQDSALQPRAHGYPAASRAGAHFVEPGNLLALLLAIGAALQSTSYTGLGCWLTLTGALGVLAIVVLPIDQWLAAPLENRFTRLQWPDRVDGILVLSGAQQPYISTTREIPVQHLAQGDLVAAVELLRHYSHARLLFSGGPAWSGRTSAADVARAIFEQLGVDTQRVTYETQSRNTWENLVFSQQLVQPKRGETWLLVTRALHMPRAMAVAQRLAWPVVPWPTDYVTPGSNGWLVHKMSLGRNLPTIDAALHEWVGLMVYRLTDRTSTLFPAPANDDGAGH